MSTEDDEKDEKHKRPQGSGRPATKFMERPKPGKKPDSPSGGTDDEQYWGQGRQQKECEERE